MAKEELIHQIGNKEIFEITDEEQIQKIPQDKSIIIQSGNKDLWEKVVKSLNNIGDYVIFVKNMEEYDKSILDVIGKNEKIIFSGDLDNCNFVNELIEKSWKSKIIFTVPKDDLKIEIPKLEKYESYLVSEQTLGILRLEKIEQNSSL